MNTGVLDLTGRVLSGRYRLLSGAGMGSSGIVYVADDIRLKRQVAVKVLHRGYNSDAAFLRRFRAEAQLAGKLHHHNIVSVYDWGEDEMPYLVFELLEGGSLRSMLDEEIRLTPAQAAHVGMQVCSALDYAHSRGLVHRDIKPANLLFDEHGILRVSDFGLARALAEASFTEPTGAVVGTARYASPEQASGHGLDGRSDLYSVALVLHEAVTGEVPFATDTAVGTIAARVENDLVASPALGMLGAVIERAGKADPKDRYPDAGTMFKALSDVASALPKPGPLTLVPQDGLVVDPNPTNIVTTPTNLFDQDVEDDAEIDMSADAVSERFHTKASTNPVFGRRQLVGWFIAAFISAVLVAGFFTVATATATTVSVPNVAGLEKDEASAQIATTGLRVTFEERFSDDPKDTVIEISPQAGDYVNSSATITLTISQGPEPIDVPDVMGRGLNPEEARTVLEEAGFLIAVKREFSEEVEKDSLIGLDPKESRLAPESTITLIISDGPEPIEIPSVAGKTPQEAETILRNAGFATTTQEAFSDSVPSGTVVGTNPTGGNAVQKDSTVTILISKGPELVTVPNLVGRTVEQASATLRNLGLAADVQNYRAGARVRAQDPGPSRQVRKNSEVTLFL